MSRGNETTVRGFILDVKPQGEYGRRAVLLTDSLGKVTVFAGGAAKSSSRLIGAVRPLTSGEFVIARGRSAWNLHSVSVIDNFQELPLDPDVYAYAFYVLELAGYYSDEGMDPGEAKDLLNLIYVTLRALRGDYGDGAVTGQEGANAGDREAAVYVNSLPPRHPPAAGFIISVYELRLLVMQGEYTEQALFNRGNKDRALIKKINALWQLVIKLPLPALYRTALAADKETRSGFEEAVEVLFKKQVQHTFRSLQILHGSGL